MWLMYNTDKPAIVINTIMQTTLGMSDSNKMNFQKTFEEEIFTRNQFRTSLEIFFQLGIYSKVIFKSIQGPDDFCYENLQA